MNISKETDRRVLCLISSPPSPSSPRLDSNDGAGRYETTAAKALVKPRKKKKRRGWLLADCWIGGGKQQAHTSVMMMHEEEETNDGREEAFQETRSKMSDEEP